MYISPKRKAILILIIYFFISQLNKALKIPIRIADLLAKLDILNQWSVSIAGIILGSIYLLIIMLMLKIISKNKKKEGIMIGIYTALWNLLLTFILNNFLIGYPFLAVLYTLVITLIMCLIVIGLSILIFDKLGRQIEEIKNIAE